jgi:hypothetical protein
MTDPREVVYVETDIPAGITIEEWRADRSPEGIAARDAARPWRRRARPIPRWLAASLAWACQLDRRGREAQQ